MRGVSRRRSRRGSVLTVLITATALVAGIAGAAFADLGVDVSRWQHGTSADLNWSKAQADGVTFAFIKATEGSTYTNPYFAGDWASTASLGIYHGAYHFARPSAGSAVSQARYFVSVAGLSDRPGDLPPVLDLETTGGLGVGKLVAWTRAWLEEVESLTGRAPILYFSPSFWETNLGNDRSFTHYPLWIAHYTNDGPRVPGGWATWTFWQKTSSGRISGISGNVDVDYFNGTPEALRALANDAAPASPTPISPVTPLPTTPTVAPTTPSDPISSAPVPTLPAPSPTPTPPPVVAPAPTHTATRVQLAAQHTRARRGQHVTVYGHLTSRSGAAVAGRRVLIYARTAGSQRWRRVASGRSVAPTGWYQAPVASRRTTVYKAVFRGASGLLPDTSGRVRIRVR